jgi:prephenate dehydrogenase
MERAIERGAIHAGFDSPAAAVAGADLVILCTPVGVFADILSQIADALKPGAIVTDVGSTKRSIVEFAERTLPSTVYFVGSHPMAGGEKAGIDHARADLLTGAKCIITPTASSNLQAVETVESFWRELKLQTTSLSPEAHDRLVSDISHLPHAIAAALVRIQSPESLQLAARGFADSTRIAAGDAGLWRDIFMHNRENLKAGIRRLHDELAVLSAHLDADDGPGLNEWLATASETRRKFGTQISNQQRSE